MHTSSLAEPRRTGALLSFTSLACALVAMWLVTVLMTIVPVRDPARVPLWSAIAFGFVAIAAAGFLAARLGRLALGPALFACVGGSLMLTTALTSPRAEGYVLVMGLLALAQGVTLAVTVLRRRTRVVAQVVTV